MRFLNVAFVMTAFTICSPLVQAQEGVAPEVFAACEVKTPNDFKQQLACVKDQVEAQNALKDLKENKTRQIVVTPKATYAKDARAEGYCETQHSRIAAKDKWTSCVAAETAAHAAMEAALQTTDTDIPGDAYAVCRNFVSAFQISDTHSYVSQVQMLQCLKAKAPTRDFARCYENFVQRIFTRKVISVPAENAANVADCFNATLAGGP